MVWNSFPPKQINYRFKISPSIDFWSGKLMRVLIWICYVKTKYRKDNDIKTKSFALFRLKSKNDNSLQIFSITTITDQQKLGLLQTTSILSKHQFDIIQCFLINTNSTEKQNNLFILKTIVLADTLITNVFPISEYS